jgi:ABC-2 type transport system permease protein
MDRILAVAKKEFIHIIRDPRALYLNLGLPLVLLLILGFAISFELREEPVYYLDFDRSKESREFLERIASESSFDNPRESPLPAFPLLRSGRARIFLVIPPDFSKNLNKGKEAEILALVDGADNNTASIAIGVLEEISGALSYEWAMERFGHRLKKGLLFPSIRILYNPELKSSHYIVPGLIALIMMMVSVLMTALTVSREWETGTLEKILSSPLRVEEILLGKTISYFILGFIQIALILLAGKIVFGVPFRGSLLLLLFFSALFILGGLGLGLLISVATRSQQLAMQVSWLLTILPGFLLSGFLFPIESMPKILQAISYLVPAKYYLIVLRGILLKGATLIELWPQAVFLTIYAVLSIALAFTVFPRRLE